MSARTFMVFALLAVSSAALAQTCPARASWPTTDWPVNLVNADAKKAELKDLEDFAFTLTGEDQERKGIRTDGLLIIQHGAIVYERYGRGFDASKRHISWSVAKSVSSALIGIAVKDGALKLSDSICVTLPEYEGTPQCAITVKDVISFSSGLAWQEEYENGSYQSSSVISMFFGVGHRDQLKHVLTHKLFATPGQAWRYSTGDATVSGTIAKRALAKRHGADAFWKMLYEPIGMTRVVEEEDVKGTVLGGSHLFATPRDFARFGYLFLNDGCWNGQRILPEGWVRDSTTVSDVFTQFAPASETLPAGYSWWLNRPVPSRGQPVPWPDLPEDTYTALGHWGQRIVVIPSLDAVVVRTGDDREGSVDVNELTKRALAVIR